MEDNNDDCMYIYPWARSFCESFVSTGHVAIHRGFDIGKSSHTSRPSIGSSRVVYVINVFLACSIGNIHYAICKRVISGVLKQRVQRSAAIWLTGANINAA